MHRKFLPSFTYLIAWVIYLGLGHQSIEKVFIDTANNIPVWFMSITMVFGGFVAGFTSCGGSAVAFPVMNLLFQFSPTISRDFGLLIQSFGMTTASFSILLQKTSIDTRAIAICSSSGALGFIIGLSFIVNEITPIYKKMFYASIWYSFAYSHYLTSFKNSNKTSKCSKTIKSTLLIFLIGFFGGIFTSMAGGGIDMILFALMTLTFNVDDKIATRTSIISMAINTVFGSLWRIFINTQGLELELQRKLLQACVPIVVVCAPLGSIVCNIVSHRVLLFSLYFLCSLQLLTALIVTKPWSYGSQIDALVLCVSSFGVLFGSLGVFKVMNRISNKFVKFELELEAQVVTQTY